MVRTELHAAHASWLNQVERFFALITNEAIRQGSFISADEPFPGSKGRLARALSAGGFGAKGSQGFVPVIASSRSRVTITSTWPLVWVT